MGRTPRITERVLSRVEAPACFETAQRTAWRLAQRPMVRINRKLDIGPGVAGMRERERL
jgi:hypothetical protein